jgi:phosphoglycolate phosphatase
MDSIIFDLDGTLWDSSENVLIFWNDVLKNKTDVRRLLVLEDLHGIMGLQMKEIGERFFPYLAEERREELLNECSEIECQLLSEKGGVLYDKVEETLRALSEKYKLFIVSNCQKGYIEAFFHYHQLGKYFNDYENPGRTGLSKGENIKLVMERNQLQNPVYVGDTAGDQKGAEVAGIPFVYASYGFGEVSHFDFSIQRFEDLLQLF